MLSDDAHLALQRILIGMTCNSAALIDSGFEALTQIFGAKS